MLDRSGLITYRRLMHLHGLALYTGIHGVTLMLMDGDLTLVKVKLSSLISVQQG